MDALQSGSLKWETTSSEGGDPTAVFRIDAEVDFIVGERYMSVTTFDGGGMELEVTVTLSDFNEPMDIQPPAPELTDTETGQWMAELAGDDHGDSPSAAYAELLAGRADEARIETGADRDVFTFSAIEGRRYVLEVTLCTLAGAALSIIDAQSNLLADSGGPTNSTAPRIEWTAPASGDYYASVQGADGASGSYRLSLLELDEQQQP